MDASILKRPTAEVQQDLYRSDRRKRGWPPGWHPIPEVICRDLDAKSLLIFVAFYRQVAGEVIGRRLVDKDVVVILAHFR